MFSLKLRLIYLSAPEVDKFLSQGLPQSQEKQQCHSRSQSLTQPLHLEKAGVKLLFNSCLLPPPGFRQLHKAQEGCRTGRSPVLAYKRQAKQPAGVLQGLGAVVSLRDSSVSISSWLCSCSGCPLAAAVVKNKHPPQPSQH